MNHIFKWVGNVISKYPKTILIVSLVAFALLIAGVNHIKMATGNETLVQTDNEVYLSNRSMESTFGGDAILILFVDDTKEKLLSIENINKIAAIENKLSDNEDLFSIMSVSTVVGQMMKSNPINEGMLPDNQAQLNQLLYDENNQIKPMFSDVVLDDQHSIMIIKLVGNLDDDSKDEIILKIQNTLDETSFETTSYVISGKPVLDDALRTEMKENMMVMVGFAVVIMLIVLTIVFKVRWRMISLAVILVSVITTLGLMGIFDIPITMVSMAVFPILIGLGIDYSIQFHNRYEEEQSVTRTITQIGKAVSVAVIATVLGFVSLYASPVPMIQDFGLMLTIGIIISFIGSIFILMPILKLRFKLIVKKSKRTKMKIKKIGLLERSLNWSTKKVLKYTTLVLVLSSTLAVAGVVVDQQVGVETNIESFMPQDMNALKDIHLVRDVLGSTDQVVIYMRDDQILKEDNILYIQTKTAEISEKYSNIIVDVKSIDSLVSRIAPNQELSHQSYLGVVSNIPIQQAKMFINADQTESVILINIKHLPTEALQSFVEDLNSDFTETSMDVQVTGKSVMDIEMVNGLTSGRVTMTILGLLLVFLVLLIIYRNPYKAILPIIPVVMIVGMSSGLMFLLGISYTPITATLGALVLGMGTEMTVMLLERYIEERVSGKEKMDAMIMSVSKIGKAIVASGLTTIGGFSVLLLSDFIILKDFGLMTVINITLALLSTFIILPPVILILDRLIMNKSQRKKINPEQFMSN